MKKLFSQIKRIDKVAYRSLPKAVCKLGEEYGELVQALNMGMNMKKPAPDALTIKIKVAEEAADTIQNVFLLVSRFGITYEELSYVLKHKNSVWKNKYGKKKQRKK